MPDLSFSPYFLYSLEEFRKEQNKMNEADSFEGRFMAFREKFEKKWLTMSECDNSGLFEMVIDMPLYEDVKNKMVELLKSQNFREVEEGKFEKQNDFYFKSEKNGKTYFGVIKYKKINVPLSK